MESRSSTSPKASAVFYPDSGSQEAFYTFQQDLTQILLKKRLNQREAEDLIPQFLWHMNECLESPWEALKIFGKTLFSLGKRGLFECGDLLKIMGLRKGCIREWK